MAIYKNTPPIVTNGLWLFSDFNNTNSYPGSGTTINNIIGTGYTGSLINSPTLTSDAFTKYLAFNGTNNYVKYQNESSGSATGNWSWGGWFNWGASTTNKYMIMRGRDNEGNGWSIQTATAVDNIFTAVVTTVPGVAQISAVDTNTASANTWYHVFGTWEAGVAVRLYINGIPRATTATTSTSLRTSTSGWNLASITTTNFYAVNIASVAVYNRLLSDKEIAQNYNALKSRFGLT